MSQELKNDSGPARKLLQSGIIFAAISFLTTLVHYVFQIIVSRQLGGESGEYGLALTTITFIGFLGLPLAIATQAVTHYIARFHFSGDDARLQGLLAGCRKFLFHITIAGSVIAIVLVKPLGDYFNIPRTSLTLIALACVLGGLWGSYVTALCQGLAWFKRLAFIGLLAALMRVLFGWLTTRIWPRCRMGGSGLGVMLLANLILLFWKKDFPRRTDTAISPWDREFVQFLVVSAACMVGTNCFSQGDLLVANKFFAKAIWMPTAPPDCWPVPCQRLSARCWPFCSPIVPAGIHGDALREQLKLLGLYAFGLLSGAIGLFVLKTFVLQLLHRNTPEAAGMIGRFSITMVFVGLLQALAMWSLASRWIKLSMLYGGLGIAYWITLLCLGKSPADLLRVMPVAAGVAFGAVFLIWLIAMLTHKIGEPAKLI
jgi:hypothetical protein